MSRTKLLTVMVSIAGLTIAAIPSCSGAEESNDIRRSADFRKVQVRHRRKTFDFRLTESANLNWIEAKKYCEYYNAALPRILSAEGEKALEEALGRARPNVKGFWIGGHNPSKDGYHYTWSPDDTPFRYMNWYNNQQRQSDAGGEEYCVAVFDKSRGYKWFTNSCTSKKPVVCQFPHQTSGASQSSDEIHMDKFIFFPNTKLNWKEAINHCETRGFNLITIESGVEELQLVRIMARDNLVQDAVYWIQDDDFSDEAPNEYTECVEFSYTPSSSSNGQRRNDGRNKQSKSGERRTDQCTKTNSVICQKTSSE